MTFCATNIEAPLGNEWWVIAVLLTIGAGVLQIMKIRLKVRNDATAFRKLTFYTLVVVAFGAMPWLLMGTLLETGRVNSIAEFIDGGNVWVIGWYAVLFVESIAGVACICFLGGAELVESYPFLVNLRCAKKEAVKAGVVCVVVGFWFVFIAVKSFMYGVRHLS